MMWEASWRPGFREAVAVHPAPEPSLCSAGWQTKAHWHKLCVLESSEMSIAVPAAPAGARPLTHFLLF
jgi:hypothetical protein